MKFQAGYEWLHPYVSSHKFWVEDVLTWEDSFNFATTDYTLFSLLTLPFFSNLYIHLTSFSKLSVLDVFIMYENVDFLENQEFYNAIIWDLSEMIQILFYSSQFIYYTSSQDFSTLLLYHSPELVIPFIEFILTYSNTGIFKSVLSIGSTVFTDLNIQRTSKVLNMVTLLGVLLCTTLIFFYIFRLTKWNNSLESYMTRLTLYFYSLSKENRLQFESVLLTVALFTLFFMFNVVTFKDLCGESIEQLTLLLFNSFLVIYVFFLYKNSIHYFSFLEGSVQDGNAISFFLQFNKDVTNSMVLWLRFLALLVRLNIYDTLDDVLDSNYIFACDFQDESSTSDLWARFYSIITSDLTSDLAYSVEKNNMSRYSTRYVFDLFSIYFVICAKLVSFIFFALEGTGRVLLAFFILYLVIFEMQSVNRSYTEDEYVTTERQTNNH